MNLQTFLDAIPSFLWSDGNGAASGLAVTAELFLLSIVPGMALAIANRRRRSSDNDSP